MMSEDLIDLIFPIEMKGPVVALPNDERRASTFASSEGLGTF